MRLPAASSTSARWVPLGSLTAGESGKISTARPREMCIRDRFLGWQNTLLAMFFGILGGGVYGMYLLAAKKADKKDHFAFGS